MKRLAAVVVLAMALQSNSSTNAAAPAQNKPQAPADLNSILEPIRQKNDLPALAGAIVTSKLESLEPEQSE